MILEAAVGAAGLWSLRSLAHHAILRGLRAPRLPHGPVPAGLALTGAQVHEVQVTGPRGKRLFGWWVLPIGPAPSADRPLPAVLALHGWGANASTMWPVVPPLVEAGFAVLLIDARCHGRSDDERYTSLPRFAEDLAAGLAWLRRQPGVAGDRLALLGHSVGAGAALLHAARHADVRAVVSLSAFAHPREVMRRFMRAQHVPYPLLGWYVMRHVQRVIGHRFDDIAPLTSLPRVRCPVLLVHGTEDRTVPFDDARRLRAAQPRARLLPVAGDHDLRDALGPHRDTLVRFLTEACAVPVQPPAAATVPSSTSSMPA